MHKEEPSKPIFFLRTQRHFKADNGGSTTRVNIPGFGEISKTMLTATGGSRHKAKNKKADVQIKVPEFGQISETSLTANGAAVEQPKKTTNPGTDKGKEGGKGKDLGKVLNPTEPTPSHPAAAAVSVTKPKSKPVKTTPKPSPTKAPSKASPKGVKKPLTECTMEAFKREAVSFSNSFGHSSWLFLDFLVKRTMIFCNFLSFFLFSPHF